MNHFELSDHEFMAQFVNCTLNPDLFSHEAHVRLAYLILKDAPFDQAEVQLATLILAFVKNLGFEEKFNRTITYAAAKIIKKRIENSEAVTFKTFLKQHSDLTDNMLALIQIHYSKHLLFSPEARKEIFQPDLQDF